MEPLKKLMDKIDYLIEFEKKHPDFLYTPLFEYITIWLAYPEKEKMSSMPILHDILVDSQDCDHMGTPWKKNGLKMAISVNALPVILHEKVYLS